MFINTKL